MCEYCAHTHTSVRATEWGIIEVEEWMEGRRQGSVLQDNKAERTNLHDNAALVRTIGDIVVIFG